jgi:hypothetical protein
VQDRDLLHAQGRQQDAALEGLQLIGARGRDNFVGMMHHSSTTLLLTTLICATPLTSCRCGEPLPAATDPAPKSYGTVAQGLAAAGEWVDATQVRGPQVAEAKERRRLFASEHKLSKGPLHQGLLVCQVTANDKKNWDVGVIGIPGSEQVMAPDMDVAVAVSDEPALRGSGPSNEHVAYVTVPRVDLKKGAKVQVEVWDRDVTTVDSMGRASGVFSGTFPLELTSEHFDVSCVGVGKQPGEWQITNNMLPILDHGLARLEDPKAQEGKTIDDALDALRKLQRWFNEGAAYTGWADPRLLVRRGRYHKSVQALVKRLAPTGLKARLPASLAFGDVAGKVEAYGCHAATGSGVRDCRLELELTSKVNEPIVVRPGAPGSAMYHVTLFTGAGQAVPLEVKPAADGRREDRVSKGQPLKLVLRPLRPLDREAKRFGGAHNQVIEAAYHQRPRAQRATPTVWIKL